MKRTNLRKLTEHEQKTLTPLISRYQQAEQAYLGTRQELERSLALIEPRFSSPSVGLDFATFEFYEEREAAPAKDSPTPPPGGNVKKRRRRRD